MNGHDDPGLDDMVDPQPIPDAFDAWVRNKGERPTVLVDGEEVVAPCECDPIRRIVGDNDGPPGEVSFRIMNLLGGFCNACGGVRPK